MAGEGGASTQRCAGTQRSAGAAAPATHPTPHALLAWNRSSQPPCGSSRPRPSGVDSLQPPGAGHQLKALQWFVPGVGCGSRLAPPCQERQARQQASAVGCCSVATCAASGRRAGARGGHAALGVTRGGSAPGPPSGAGQPATKATRLNQTPPSPASLPHSDAIHGRIPPYEAAQPGVRGGVRGAAAVAAGAAAGAGAGTGALGAGADA